MKTLVQQRRKLLHLAVGSGAMLAASAQAAVPQEATDAIAAMGTDFSSVLGSFWGVLATVLGGFVVIKIVKRLVGQI